jgi:hypothetical protein
MYNLRQMPDPVSLGREHEGMRPFPITPSFLHRHYRKYWVCIHAIGGSISVGPATK